MKISAFTFARNAVALNYPIREAIMSALPLVDEFVINLGLPDDDGTEDLVRSVDSKKLRIVKSHWNPNLNTGGFVLAQQTNIALFNCTGVWAIYLQADEVLHEQDYDELVGLMAEYRDADRVEGIGVTRTHFYGDFHTNIEMGNQKDLACRVVKPHRFVLSRGDAAGFTVHPKYKEKGRRIRIVESNAAVYHYGLTMSRDTGGLRQKVINDLWHGGFRTDEGVQPPESARTDEENLLDAHCGGVPRQWVKPFNGSHPSFMQSCVSEDSFQLDLGSKRWRRELTPTERSVHRRVWLNRQYRGVLRRYLSRRDCVLVRR